jgi:hypothetical protein
MFGLLSAAAATQSLAALIAAFSSSLRSPAKPGEVSSTTIPAVIIESVTSLEMIV